MKNTFKFSKTISVLCSAVIITMTISACGKGTVEPPVDDIIGLWTATDVSTVITYNDMSAYDYWLSQGATPEEAEYQMGYQTRGHETYIPILMDFKATGILKVVSGKIGDADGYHQEDTWVLSTDRKTLTFFGLDAIVHSLTKSDMTYQLIFDSDEYSQELMTYDLTITYTK